MRPFTLTIILTAILCSSAAAQSALPMVPPDAGAVFGIEWRGILDSPAGAEIRNQLAKPEIAKMPQFQFFQDTLLNNLESILIAAPVSSLKGATQPPVLLIIKGRFQLAAIRSMIMGLGKTGPVEKYRSVELIATPETGPPSGKPNNNRIALLDSSTILAGDKMQIRSAIDRIESGRAAPPHSGILEGVAELAAANHIWMAFRVPADAVKDAPNGMNKMMADVKSAQLGVSFGDGLAMRINVRTTDSTSANLVAQTVQGLIGMAALSGGSENPQVGELLSKVRVAPEGSLVKIALTLNQSEFDKMIRDSQTIRMAGRPATTGIATRAPEPAGPKTIRITGLDSGPVEVPYSGAKK